MTLLRGYCDCPPYATGVEATGAARRPRPPWQNGGRGARRQAPETPHDQWSFHPQVGSHKEEYSRAHKRSLAGGISRNSQKIPPSPPWYCAPFGAATQEKRTIAKGAVQRDAGSPALVESAAQQNPRRELLPTTPSLLESTRAWEMATVPSPSRRQSREIPPVADTSRHA